MTRTTQNTQQGDNRRSNLDVEVAIARAFRPAAPIDDVDLFAGRQKQVRAILDVIFQEGQHAVLYGERGVGKTSLTTVLSDIVQAAPPLLALRTNCDGTDTYSTIWAKILDEVELNSERAGPGLVPNPQLLRVSAADLLPNRDAVTPNDVRRALDQVSRTDATLVIFIDEFDRLEDQESRRLFADTIKTLSDARVAATIVLVGVADNVDELIAEHQSIERALVQVHMPRMSGEELQDIVHRGLKLIGMTIDEAALLRITRLSQGLPHYTHLIAQSAARWCFEASQWNIETDHLEGAITDVLNRAQRSVISAYVRAISSTRENLYRQVLLACALATVDDLGYFAAVDIRPPLSEIMGRPFDIPLFARHLNEFCSQARGPVLLKKGAARSFRYRFIDPLLQPYVAVRGVADGLIDASMMKTLT